MKASLGRLFLVLGLFLGLVGIASMGQAATMQDLVKADSSELRYYAKYRINPVNPYFGRNPPITVKVLEDQMAEESQTRQDPAALHLMIQAALQYRLDEVAQGMSGWDALNTAIGLYESYGEKFPLVKESMAYWLELSNLYLTGRYYLKYDRAFTTLSYQQQDKLKQDLPCFRFTHELYHPANTPKELEGFYRACKSSSALAFLKRKAAVDYKAFVANGRRGFKDQAHRRRFKP